MAVAASQKLIGNLGFACRSEVNGASLRRISAFHSGIFTLRDAIYASDKFAPPAKLRSQNPAALPREPIIPAASLVGFFDPAPLYPATPFEAVQERVKRSHMETNRSARALLNEQANSPNGLRQWLYLLITDFRE